MHHKLYKSLRSKIGIQIMWFLITEQNGDCDNDGWTKNNFHNKLILKKSGFYQHTTTLCTRSLQFLDSFRNCVTSHWKYGQSTPLNRITNNVINRIWVSFLQKTVKTYNATYKHSFIEIIILVNSNNYFLEFFSAFVHELK